MIYISSINIMIDCNVKIIKYEKDKRLIGVFMIFWKYRQLSHYLGGLS